MPHIILEHSANVKADVPLQELMRRIHLSMSEICGINIANCKSRCRVADEFRIGEGERLEAFVHLDVRFIEGRSLENRQQLGRHLKTLLMESFATADAAHELQITIEVRDILLEEYFKHPEGSLTQQ